MEPISLVYGPEISDILTRRSSVRLCTPKPCLERETNLVPFGLFLLVESVTVVGIQIHNSLILVVVI